MCPRSMPLHGWRRCSRIRVVLALASCAIPLRSSSLWAQAIVFTFAPGFTIDTTLPAGNSTPAIARCPGAYELSLRLYRVRQREKRTGAGVEWNNGVAISRESSPRGMIRVVITDFVLMKISWLSRGGSTNSTNVSGKEERIFRTQINVHVKVFCYITNAMLSELQIALRW